VKRATGNGAHVLVGNLGSRWVPRIEIRPAHWIILPGSSGRGLQAWQAVAAIPCWDAAIVVNITEMVERAFANHPGAGRA
jgi:hypothetical protein